MNGELKTDVKEASVKFAAVGVNEFFPETKKDLVSLHFVSNALAHGFYKGWEFFEQRKRLHEEESLKSEASLQTLQYTDAIKAWGKDRDLVSGGFNIGFIHGYKSATASES